METLSCSIRVDRAGPELGLLFCPAAQNQVSGEPGMDGPGLRHPEKGGKMKLNRNFRRFAAKLEAEYWISNKVNRVDITVQYCNYNRF